jgi:rubrerythrin
MSNGTGADRTQRIIELLRKWQGLERKGIDATAQIMEETDNPLIWQVMEIIRNDSVQHHRVQRFLIDSLTRKPVTLSPEEMAQVWEQIETHNKMERETVEVAKQLAEECTDPVQKELLEYLLTDEEKHVKLLDQLEEIKKHMAKRA